MEKNEHYVTAKNRLMSLARYDTLDKHIGLFAIADLIVSDKTPIAQIEKVIKSDIYRLEEWDLGITDDQLEIIYGFNSCSIYGEIISIYGFISEDEYTKFNSKSDRFSHYTHRYILQRNLDALSKYLYRISEYINYWDSGKHPEQTPLSYYIEWARRKKISISWESLAIDLEIIEGPAHPKTAPAHSPWPWGTYRTKHLDVLSAAVKRYWVNYDPEDISTAPTNEAIVEWLKSNHKLSENMAKAIASIIRADGLPTGPR